MAETVESEETKRARAQTAKAEQDAQAQPRVLNQNTTVQHPDTKEWHTFAADDEAPDWAQTVLGAGMFRTDNPAAEEIRLSPVPGFGQTIPNRLIGEDGDGESLSEAKANEVNTDSATPAGFLPTNVRDAAGDTAGSNPVPVSESDSKASAAKKAPAPKPAQNNS